MAGRSAFTLAELVVVVLILGIITAVAAPKVFDASEDANANSLEHSLGVVQDAISFYTVHNAGQYPGEKGTEADFKADLKLHLQRFPENPLLDSDVVDVQTTGKPLTETRARTRCGWRYDNQTAEFIANADVTARIGEISPIGP